MRHITKYCNPAGSWPLCRVTVGRRLYFPTPLALLTRNDFLKKKTTIIIIIIIVLFFHFKYIQKKKEKIFLI